LLKVKEIKELRGGVLSCTPHNQFWRLTQRLGKKWPFLKVS